MPIKSAAVPTLYNVCVATKPIAAQLLTPSVGTVKQKRSTAAQVMSMDAPIRNFICGNDDLDEIDILPVAMILTCTTWSRGSTRTLLGMRYNATT
jgi:hypothetical protein